jgi:hypothetical protein
MQSPGHGGDSGGRIAARPSGSDTAATPSEATAKTQISAPGLTPGPAPGAGQGTQMLAQGSRVPGQQAAAQTNLSASRELTDAEMSAAAALPQKRSPIIFAIPVVAIVLIVGIGVAIKSMSGHATPDPGTTGLVQNATPPPSSTPLPTPSAAIPDTQATAANDAVKDAGVVVTNTNAKPPGQTNGGQTNTGQPNTGRNPHQQTQQQQNNGHSNVLDNDLAN